LRPSNKSTISDRLNYKTTFGFSQDDPEQQQGFDNITKADKEVLNKLQEIVFDRSFLISKKGKWVTWSVIIVLSIACILITLVYGMQFDMKAECQGDVLNRDDSCDEFISFSILVSEEISAAYCSVYQESPLYIQDYTKDLGIPASAKWLLSFSIMFLLSTFVMTVCSMSIPVIFRFYTTKQVDTDKIVEDSNSCSCCGSKQKPSSTANDAVGSEAMKDPWSMDSEYINKNIEWELVLDESCIPHTVNVQHLVENPEVLLEYAKKRAKWKPVLNGQGFEPEETSGGDKSHDQLTNLKDNTTESRDDTQDLSSNVPRASLRLGDVETDDSEGLRKSLSNNSSPKFILSSNECEIASEHDDEWPRVAKTPIERQNTTKNHGDLAVNTAYNSDDEMFNEQEANFVMPNVRRASSGTIVVFGNSPRDGSPNNEIGNVNPGN